MRFITAFILIALAATLLGRAVADTPVSSVGRGHVVPLIYDPEVTPTPLVYVSIGGKPPLRFALDTSETSALILEPWAADRLGLKKVGAPAVSGGIPYQVVAITGGLALTDANGKDAVPFDVAEADTANFGTLDTLFGEKEVAGYVGLSLFAKVAARIDFESQTLTIYQRGAPPTPTDAVSLPLTLTPDGRATVPVTVAGLPRRRIRCCDRRGTPARR
jgi:hypothetical protein